MPAALLNNVAVVSASYTDALTVVFSFGRRSFALNTFNSAIFYQLAVTPASGQSGVPEWEMQEHYLAPSLSNFDDPTTEGFPEGRQFAGIRIRSAVDPVPTNPSRVTVA